MKWWDVDSPVVERVITVVMLALLGLLIWSLGGPEPARATTATPTSWRGPVWATWYGPSFYGNRTACGQRYTQTIRGVAHRTAACGTRFTIRRGGRRVQVRVIDRCPRCVFDLSARSAQDLCGCWRPYTMRVYYRRGWAS